MIETIQENLAYLLKKKKKDVKKKKKKKTVLWNPASWKIH